MGKVKLQVRLVQGCWKEKDGIVTICFGHNSVLKMIISFKRELESTFQQGKYVVSDGRLQFLGWSGDTQPSETHHISCAYDITDPSILKLSDCDFKGNWQRVCTKLDAEVNCIEKQKRVLGLKNGSARA